MEIERIAGEVLPTNQPISPASEQFLGGLLQKVGKIVSAVARPPSNSRPRGAIRRQARAGPAAGALKKLARFLLGHIVNFALNSIPANLQPLARQLSDRLFHEIADAHESEAEQYEQTEAEAIPAAPDIARLEAEFDLHAAQLLLTPDEDRDRSSRLRATATRRRPRLQIAAWRRSTAPAPSWRPACRGFTG